MHSAHTGAHCSYLRLKRLASRLPLNLRGQPGCQAVAVLAQPQAMYLSHFHQVLANFFPRTAVGEVFDDLGYDGDVHDHLLHACLLDHAAPTEIVNLGFRVRL